MSNGKGSSRRVGENLKKFETEYERIFNRKGHCCVQMLKDVDSKKIIYDQDERRYHNNHKRLDVCPHCGERLA